MSGARVLEGEGAAGSAGAGAVLRWAACFVLVLGLHAGAAWLLRRSAPFTPPPAASEAVMLDLAPVPVAPQPAAPFSPDPMPDPEPKPDAEPPPLPEPALPVPSLPQPAVVLPEPPPPPVPKRPVPTRPARPPPRPAQASPPRPTPEVPAPSAAPASAPPPAASAAPSLISAFPGWRSELSNRLQRAKRYPDAARARDEQGAAAVAFTVDRSGHVLSATLVRSSGSPALDEEAVAMVHRADPLPPMPADMPGSTATMTLPVTFSLQ